jgi:hypothetical protein
MSKIYSDQVQKAQMLSAGLKKNYETIKNYGISREMIDRLEEDSKIATDMNKEVEDLREEVRMKSAKANKKLVDLKNNMQNAKQVIKRNFDQEQWQRFGILDKR